MRTASTTTYTYPPTPMQTLTSTYRMLEPADPRHEWMMKFLDVKQFPEHVRHWALPFETMGRQMLRSTPSCDEKRTLFRHLVEAQLAAVQAHDPDRCYYCSRDTADCGCKPGAVR